MYFSLPPFTVPWDWWLQSGALEGWRAGARWLPRQMALRMRGTGVVGWRVDTDRDGQLVLELRIWQVGWAESPRDGIEQWIQALEARIWAVSPLLLQSDRKRRKLGEANLLVTLFPFLFCILLLQRVITSGFKPRPVSWVCAAHCRLYLTAQTWRCQAPAAGGGLL